MLRFIYHQPMSVLIFVFGILIIAWAVLNSNLNKFKKLPNVAIAFATVLVIVYTTLLQRTVGNYQLELRPFYTFIMAQIQVEYYRTFFMNALLFVPLGLSMPYVLSKRQYKRNIFITIGFAAVLSAGIEFAQYYYHLGRCETDDVIANTLGAAVGALSYCLYTRILKNRKESLMDKQISDNQKLLMNLCAKSLFNKDCDLPNELNVQELLDEARRQTIFTQIFTFVKQKSDKNADKLFSQVISKNIRVEYAHNEVHRVLNDNDIPYVILKGVASASYYKEPMLRMMGDVDILVSPDDIEKADILLKSIGFVTTDDIDGDDMHIGYKRKDGISCELHRKIGWAPKNEVGEIVLNYFSDIFEQGIKYKTSNGSCIIPNKFHHGLVLLLHTATHLTHEGVGLRHLCDWAVFVNNFSNDEFINTFEKPLKDMGLWRFAQLLTLCSIKYLGCDEKEWIGEADDDLLDEIITDVLNGGNFGYKDAERYNQIKYISDRKSGEKAKKAPVVQLFSSINEKTKKDFKFANKFKILLPIGWFFTVCKYFYMVIMGKRRIDSISTITGAKKRKIIYEQFKLFENDQA